ncbi:MAG: isoprenyl transferase [Planctomycetota bacterium]|jgi:undecaprenyl diphosphate synthase
MRADLPGHVAIIMDGNGRWAKARKLRRTRGHAEGVESVRAVTRHGARRKLRQLTLYAFSEENWKRPAREVRLLMRLLRRFLIRERGEIMDNDIRLEAIGRIDRLPADVRKELDKTREMSRANRGMVLNLALSYGGRQEIVDAMRAIARRVEAGELKPDDITEEVVTAHLYQPEMPPPDLLIRTAGELRVSNFLLWQISYTELYVTPVTWPEFREEGLDEALAAYRGRVRKFGGLVPEAAP